MKASDAREIVFPPAPEPGDHLPERKRDHVFLGFATGSERPVPKVQLADYVVLRRDRIVVRKTISGELKEIQIRLADVADGIELTKRRQTIAIPALLLLAAVFAVAAWRFLLGQQNSVPLYGLCGMIAVFSVLAAFGAIRSFKVACIRNRRGNTWVELWCEKKNTWLIDEFLLQLQRRMDAFREEEGPNQSSQTAPPERHV